MRDEGHLANPWMWALVLLVVCGILAGLYGRFHELGTRQLAVDEYYFVQSIDSIRETGLPRFPTGGYYTRGIIQQYLTAASTALFDDEGFAYRLPSAIFGVIAILLTFFYARRHLGTRLAVMAALLLALSSWNIEFSRFARMYAPLQVVTLIFLLTLDLSWRDHKRLLRYWPHVILFAGMLTHQLAILLAPLLLLPYFSYLGHHPSSSGQTSRNASFSIRRPGIAYGSISLLVMALLVLLLRFDFRSFGVVSRYPEDYLPQASSSFLRLPDFPFLGIENQLLGTLGVLALLVICSLLIFFLMRNRASDRAPVVLAGCVMVSCLAHMFFLAGLFVLVMLLRFDIHRRKNIPRAVYIFLGAAVLITIGWLIFAMADRSWMDRVMPGDSLKAIYFTFLSLPDLYVPIVKPWRLDLPIFGSLVFLGVAGQLIRHRHAPIPELVWNPAMLLVYVALAVGLLNTSYDTTRYLFFVYPLMLVAILATMRDLVNWVLPSLTYHRQEFAASLLCALGFIVSEEFHIGHLLHPTAVEINYRMGNYESMAPVWYWRYDYESAARFAEAQVENDSSARLLVYYNAPPASRYISRAHTVYHPRTHDRFRSVSRQSGTVDMWSNQKLLSTPEEFQAYARQARTLLVVWRLSSELINGMDWDELMGDLPYEARIAYVSTDRRIQVTELIIGARSNSEKEVLQ